VEGLLEEEMETWKTTAAAAAAAVAELAAAGEPAT